MQIQYFGQWGTDPKISMNPPNTFFEIKRGPGRLISNTSVVVGPQRKIGRRSANLARLVKLQSSPFLSIGVLFGSETVRFMVLCWHPPPPQGPRALIRLITTLNQDLEAFCICCFPCLKHPVLSRWTCCFLPQDDANTNLCINVPPPTGRKQLATWCDNPSLIGAQL